MAHISSIRRRSSLFSTNQQLQSASDPCSISGEHNRYEKQLRLEIKQWTHLLRIKCQKLQQMRSASRKIDQSILSEEQRSYLADGPIVESFISETDAFHKGVEVYVSQKTYLMERYAYIVREAKALVELELKDAVARELSENI